ncbi:MAG: hypothetical protein M3Y41_06975, partial [Pseudomonadota bacterium]|nr:hypothetical protein [Pseudomonadota bacterium]
MTSAPTGFRFFRAPGRRHFANGVCELAATLSSLLVSAFAQQTTSEPFAAVLNGPATLDEIYGANGHFLHQSCHRPECLAMADIADMYEVLTPRDTPSGNTLLDPQSFNPRDYNNQVDRLIRSHPDRVGLYCRILTKIASHWHDDAQEGTEIGALVIELATRVDEVGRGCTPAV